MSKQTVHKFTEDNKPAEDGRYGVIFRDGSKVGRMTEDYSTELGWLTGMGSVEIIAWWELPDFPAWLVEQYSPKAEAV